MKKIGRNDPCPCGTGKKYKKCHGRAVASQQVVAPASRLSRLRWTVQPITPASVPPKVMRELMAHEQSEQERIRRFGQVRPEIAADYQGHKFVAVGNQLYYDERWKFFADFLVDHVPHVFGREWFEGEIA